MCYRRPFQRDAHICRGATVEALTELTCLTLARDRFTELLGPLQDIMKRDKSPEVRR